VREDEEDKLEFEGKDKNIEEKSHNERKMGQLNIKRRREKTKKRKTNSL
jgi:hypothetical protein